MFMLKIIFETHSTTYDNENAIASGHADAKLSTIGRRQAIELGERYKNIHLDAIFCSDLSRSYETAEIAFGGTGIPIIRDTRLRECDYGSFTQHPRDEVIPLKTKYLEIPFPNGESIEETAEKMKSFLQYLLEEFNGKIVMIIGHRATQHALEHWIKGLTLENAVSASWKWQPGWGYYLKKPHVG
jgi:broad specificity phosphatase PhoE